MARQSTTIGKPFVFSRRWLNSQASSWETFPALLQMLAYSASAVEGEVYYLLDYLEKQELILTKEQSALVIRGDIQHEGYRAFVVTPRGHARVAELMQIASSSAQGFVAMWFDPSMQSVFEDGFAAGIRDAGYNPLRIDGKQHNNKIDDEIIAEIRRSRFLVADFTQGSDGARGGVYYEAGFAHGHNIPVVFTCSKNAIGKVHFDTRQYNHIVWEDAADLRKRLADRISATIGDGPLKRL